MDRQLTESERAFALLDRLLKHTEPGGIFAFATEAKAQQDIDAREEFLAEVAGVLTVREPGAAPPEIIVAASRLALREVRGILAEGNKAALPLLLAATIKLGGNVSDRDKLAAFDDISRVGEVLTKAVAAAGAALDEYMHTFGVPVGVARTRPPKEEIDKMFVAWGDKWCDCAKCRTIRAGEALDKLKNGGAKSQ